MKYFSVFSSFIVIYCYKTNIKTTKMILLAVVSILFQLLFRYLRTIVFRWETVGTLSGGAVWQRSCHLSIRTLSPYAATSANEWQTSCSGFNDQLRLKTNEDLETLRIKALTNSGKWLFQTMVPVWKLIVSILWIELRPAIGPCVVGAESTDV